jgi:hypothetical protein
MSRRAENAPFDRMVNLLTATVRPIDDIVTAAARDAGSRQGTGTRSSDGAGYAPNPSTG